MTGMGNLSLMVHLLRTHAPSAFLLEDHDYKGRIGVGSKTNNSRF
jgi:hypothetical protein